MPFAIKGTAYFATKTHASCLVRVSEMSCAIKAMAHLAKTPYHSCLVRASGFPSSLCLLNTAAMCLAVPPLPNSPLTLTRNISVSCSFRLCPPSDDISTKTVSNAFLPSASFRQEMCAAQHRRKVACPRLTHRVPRRSEMHVCWRVTALQQAYRSSGVNLNIIV